MLDLDDDDAHAVAGGDLGHLRVPRRPPRRRAASTRASVGSTRRCPTMRRASSGATGSGCRRWTCSRSCRASAPIDMDHDCCGVAGTYGLKKEKYDIAMAVGDPLFRRVRATESGAARALRLRDLPLADRACDRPAGEAPDRDPRGGLRRPARRSPPRPLDDRPRRRWRGGRDAARLGPRGRRAGRGDRAPAARGAAAPGDGHGRRPGRRGVQRRRHGDSPTRTPSRPPPERHRVRRQGVRPRADAAASCAAWPTAPALTVSNGVGAEEIVAEARPDGGADRGLGDRVRRARPASGRWPG